MKLGYAGRNTESKKNNFPVPKFLKISYLCPRYLKRGALIQRAEIIPIEPDAASTDEGNRVNTGLPKHVSLYNSILNFVTPTTDFCSLFWFVIVFQLL